MSFLYQGGQTMSRLKKALCLFLSVVFLFQLLPVTALAADGDASYTNESFQPVDMSDAVAADEIAVLGEDTSLREEFTKQYTLENGGQNGGRVPQRRALRGERRVAGHRQPPERDHGLIYRGRACGRADRRGRERGAGRRHYGRCRNGFRGTQRWTTAKRWISPNRRCATPRERSP